MESYKSWLKSCVRNNLTLEQMVFLYLIKLKDFTDPKSWSNQYVTKVQKFSVEKVISPLLERDLLMNLNSPGEFYPEFLVPTEAGEQLFATYAMAEEFWAAYPKLLPIHGSGNFVSRSGIEKDAFVDEYLSKIAHDPTVHMSIMSKLPIYEAMVKAGKINGHKIVNFVREELWEAVPDEDKPVFGRNA